MAVTPDQMLAAAEGIGNGASEVHWRNAASRAYYAAYHRCRRMAAEEGMSIPEGGSEHAALVAGLRNGPNAPIRRLGDDLDRCRVRRGKADYEIDVSYPRQLALTVLADCRKILEEAGRV